MSRRYSYGGGIDRLLGRPEQEYLHLDKPSNLSSLQWRPKQQQTQKISHHWQISWKGFPFTQTFPELMSLPPLYSTKRRHLRF